MVLRLNYCSRCLYYSSFSIECHPRNGLQRSKDIKGPRKDNTEDLQPNQNMSRFTAIVALTLVCLFGLAQAVTPFYFGICSCFTPSYDASCCMAARGTISGNTCITGDSNATVTAYENCCASSGGTTKCKSGAGLDGYRPYIDGGYNCTTYPTITP